MAYNRSERVGEEIRKEIAMMIFGEIHDPRIGFVTITKVSVTKDLRHAKVFFTMRGSEEEREKTSEGLQSASGYIKRELGNRLKLRHIPKFILKFDDPRKSASRIEEIIKDIHKGD